MDIPREREEEEGRRMWIFKWVVLGVEDVQDEVVISMLLLFYCNHGIQGAEKEESKAKLFISDIICFLRWLMKVYCKKLQFP